MISTETDNTASDGWEAVKDHLRETVSADAFQRWFSGSRLLTRDDQTANIGVPNEIHLVWIETNFSRELQHACALVWGTNIEIKLHVLEMESQSTPSPTATVPADADYTPPLSPFTEATSDKRGKLAGLNPKYQFSNFVVGSNSQFAHAACQAVAANKAVGYNPLFIHGSSGLGKTHLMQAIGHEWLRNRPQSRVVYLTSEIFTNEFIAAVRKGDLEKFRQRYRTAELMLIDDVQFIAGKERTQEEFFHTFNTLLDGQRQVVLTSDVPAAEIKSLEPRLVSRFECGLTVELQVPQVETRMAIIHRKMEELKVRLDEKIVVFLAEKIRSNVRRLEGALTRIVTYASLAGNDIPLEKIELMLRDLLREEMEKQITIDAIQKAVAEHFELRLADMTSRRRPINVAYPRQLAMYLSRQHTRLSLMEIGEAFGGRDHGTVIHACKKIKQSMDQDPETKKLLDRLEHNLRH